MATLSFTEIRRRRRRAGKAQKDLLERRLRQHILVDAVEIARALQRVNRSRQRQRTGTRHCVGETTELGGLQRLVIVTTTIAVIPGLAPRRLCVGKALDDVIAQCFKALARHVEWYLQFEEISAAVAILQLGN